MEFALLSVQPLGLDLELRQLTVWAQGQVSAPLVPVKTNLTSS